MTLPHLRMVASSGLLYRMRDKSSLYETQLIHRFYSILSHEDFSTDDFRFLNHHCRHYFITCDSKKNMLYNGQLKRISKLFSLVPEELKNNLEWAGPE